MVDGSRFVVDAVTVRSGEATLVESLSLTVERGEVLGITGPSGAGKSSLIHVLAGLAEPFGGRMSLGDRRPGRDRDGALGLILQHHHLPGMLTAHEAVSLPMQARGVGRTEVGARSEAMLAALGLGDHAGQLISELSGGQRQRVAVARALAGEPELVIADEPTAGLDPESRATVIGLLLAAAQRGAIVIIASSEPELIDSCPRVVTPFTAALGRP